ERGPETLTGYGRANLPAHLAAAGRWEQLEKLLCDLAFIEAKCKAGQASRLLGDYDLALTAWPGYTRYDPFARPKPDPVPAWIPESVAAVLARAPDVHLDRGAGPVLAVLRGVPDDQRDPGPQAPRHGVGNRVPDEQFGPDQGVRPALDAMRRAE